MSDEEVDSHVPILHRDRRVGGIGRDFRKRNRGLDAQVAGA